MILAQPTWGGAIIKTSADRTGLGIFTATTIRAATTDFLLLGTYWPILNKADEHTQSLTAHLQQYIKKTEKKHQGSPLDWVKGIIEIEQSKHLATAENTCILAGDFNARWYPGPGRGGSNPAIQPWATIHGWRNTTDELLHSRHITYAMRYIDDKGISIVDHILNSGPQCVLQPNGLLVAIDVEIAEQSNHRPMGFLYSTWRKRHTGTSSQRESTKRLKLLRTELTLKDKAEV